MHTMKLDQDRIQTLLKDTVVMLCRNGLVYQSEIRIQGLLGITVDSSDVFLVSMDEIINCHTGETIESASRPFENRPSEVLQGHANSPHSKRICHSRDNQWSSMPNESTVFKTEPVTSLSGENSFNDTVSSLSTPYFSENTRQRCKRSKISAAMSSITDGSEISAENRPGDDDAILIDSGDELVKQETYFDGNAVQQSEHYEHSEFDNSAMYFNDEGMHGDGVMSTSKVDSDEVQPYFDYSVNAQGHVDEREFMPEDGYKPERIIAKNSRKPAPFFNSRGLTTWRRRQAHHRVSNSLIVFYSYQSSLKAMIEFP